MTMLLLLLVLPLLLVMMAIAKKQHKTPHGLYNQGATCYLNSVLQLLFMTPQFHDRLNPDSNTDQELKTFFENLKEGPCETENITEHFEINDVHRQRDAAEYLELILNKMSSSASQIFRGELIYATKCSEGHSVIEENNPFWTLPLPLKNENNGHFSVVRGLERIFEKKMFNGAYCNHCLRDTAAKKECEMKTTPQVLILVLKRFVFNYATESHVKTDCSVDIPSTLEIKKKQYALYGIVNHWGSLRGGHYTATIQSSEDETWYEFNDNSVQKAEEQLFDRYRSRTAYLLTYRERSFPQSISGATSNRKIAFIVILSVLIVIALVLGLVLGLVLKK